MSSSTNQGIAISAFTTEVNICLPLKKSQLFIQMFKFKTSLFWSTGGKRRKCIFQYSTGVLFHPLQYIQFRCIWKAGEKKRGDTFQKLSDKTSRLSFISSDHQTTWLRLKATPDKSFRLVFLLLWSLLPVKVKHNDDLTSKDFHKFEAWMKDFASAGSQTSSLPCKSNNSCTMLGPQEA